MSALSGLSADLQRHLQHGRDGLLRSLDDLGDAGTWSAYVAKIQQVADAYR